MITNQQQQQQQQQSGHLNEQSSLTILSTSDHPSVTVAIFVQYMQ
jgi:hypothetical protein